KRLFIDKVKLCFYVFNHFNLWLKKISLSLIWQTKKQIMNNTTTIRKVAIVGYNRIPFARANTAYSNVGNQEMMTAALNGLIDKYNLKGELLGEVAGGAVIKHTYDSNLIRECVMKTALDPATPACALQQACDTGIESA